MILIGIREEAVIGDQGQYSTQVDKTMRRLNPGWLPKYKKNDKTQSENAGQYWACLKWVLILFVNEEHIKGPIWHP